MITRKVIAAVLTGLLLVGCGTDTSVNTNPEAQASEESVEEKSSTAAPVIIEMSDHSNYVPEGIFVSEGNETVVASPEEGNTQENSEDGSCADCVVESTSGETEEDFKNLVTDDKKIVINMNGLTNVFYHEGNNVTKLTQFRNYETNENAVEVFNQMVSARDSGEFFTDTDLENMRVVGKYVVWEVGEKFVSGSMGLNKDELPTVDEVNEFSKIFVKGE